MFTSAIYRSHIRRPLKSKMSKEAKPFRPAKPTEFEKKIRKMRELEIIEQTTEILNRRPEQFPPRKKKWERMADQF